MTTRLSFRAEAFNLTNHAQFFGAAAVEGNISSGVGSRAVSSTSPRPDATGAAISVSTSSAGKPVSRYQTTFDSRPASLSSAARP